MKIKSPFVVFFVLLVLSLACSPVKKSPRVTARPSYRFDFGPGKLGKGYTRVLPGMAYSSDRGYGFYEGAQLAGVERQSRDALTAGLCTSDEPFYFAVDVPEGNYNVKFILGGTESGSEMVIKAESRRLMLEGVTTGPGQVITCMATVNVRYKTISSGKEVRLTSRELGHFNWDQQLTLEFNGKQPAVCALEITPVEDAITVYLAGNSTVTDQRDEPWASWGQMLPRFFKAGHTAIANHAESGESLKRFLAENRLEKILSTMKAGDYLFIQFGHNDQKKESSAYVEPFTGYKEYLKRFIDAARSKGGLPVLVTPVNRRTFDDSGSFINSHGDYPEAMRQVAREEQVPLIGLNAMSKLLFEALGPEGSKKAFVHYPAGTFPGQEKALADDSHFNDYGAYQLAKCIVEGIKSNKLGLADYLVDGLPDYDPGQPEAPENWHLPLSPGSSLEKPAGH